MRNQTLQQIDQHKLIAIVRGLTADQILPLAEALLAGGISLIEVTFWQARPDTDNETAKAIHALSDAFAGQMVAGAGTVMTLPQLQLAADAGARYIISPNANEDVIRKTRALGLVSIPGCMTPTECANAHAWGADYIKLFPAGVLGPDYIKAIKAPLSHLKFMATGGVNETNIPAFLKAGACGFGVGGNLVSSALIEQKGYPAITQLAKAYVSALQSQQG